MSPTIGQREKRRGPWIGGGRIDHNYEYFSDSSENFYEEFNGISEEMQEEMRGLDNEAADFEDDEMCGC
jgi:hypothetical protein